MSEQEGKTYAVLLNVLVASMCTGDRLNRGRTYARQGAVVDLVVHSLHLTARVQGSRRAPYEVSITTVGAGPAATGVQLVPARNHVRFDCSCPDWEDPCKHAVAVMSVFADQVKDDPSLMAHWRGQVLDRTPAVLGSRALAGPASLAKHRLSDDQREQLRRFLGTPAPVALPEVVPLPPPPVVWEQPWTTMLEDVLDRFDHGFQRR